MDRKRQYHNNVIHLKLVYRCTSTLIKILIVFKETIRVNFKICREKQRPRIAKILKKKKKM